MRADIGGEKAERNAQVADQLSLSVSPPEASGTQKSAQARFGFTATKKLGNAVMRNRIRRRLKEAVRLTAPVGAQAGCDYVLIAREAAATRPFATLERDLREAFAALHAPSARGPQTPRQKLGQKPGKDTPGNTRTPSTRGRAKRPDPASEGP